MERIGNLEKWFISKSAAQDAVSGPASGPWDERTSALVEAFQMGALARDVQDHRATNKCSSALADLIAAVRSTRDLPNFVVYRGLLLKSPPEVSTAFRERSLSSWTIFPSIALRLALAQGQGLVTILRYRLSQTDAAFYIDDWEYEVLRPPYVSQVFRIAKGNVNFMGHSCDVVVADLEALEGKDEQ
ncbi:MAG: hypothetical protein KDE00_12105 [Rhodobacteraceae bacterium]|nr:hypothetical protein [Paracoccaceae bacterium]